MRRPYLELGQHAQLLGQAVQRIAREVQLRQRHRQPPGLQQLRGQEGDPVAGRVELGEGGALAEAEGQGLEGIALAGHGGEEGLGAAKAFGEAAQAISGNCRKGGRRGTPSSLYTFRLIHILMENVSGLNGDE